MTLLSTSVLQSRNCVKAITVLLAILLLIFLYLNAMNLSSNRMDKRSYVNEAANTFDGFEISPDHDRENSRNSMLKSSMLYHSANYYNVNAFKDLIKIDIVKNSPSNTSVDYDFYRSEDERRGQKTELETMLLEFKWLHSESGKYLTDPTESEINK